MTRESELASKGWVKQSTLDEPRLSEVLEMYREIGFEVHLEPFNPDEESGCSECMKKDKERYRTVYTRKPRNPDVD
jgi:hypothetical protein